MSEPNAVLLKAIAKLALVGQQAGFTIEEMIVLLNTGVSVDSLLELITGNLDRAQVQERLS